MAGELVNMSEQFSGLPMASLIGGPLKAACDSQLILARGTADFIQSVGFEDDKKTIRTAKFSFMQRIPDKDGNITDRKMEMDVPMLAIVNIPALKLKTVDVTFDMEVKSSFEDKSSLAAEASMEASLGWGCFKASVKGSVSAHKEQTRKSDNSAKYHIQVLATDEGMPEGLSRVLDIMQTAIAPKQAAA